VQEVWFEGMETIDHELFVPGEERVVVEAFVDTEGR
jgi:hypothetical protein